MFYACIGKGGYSIWSLYSLSDFFFFFQVCIAVDLPPVGKRFEEWIDGCLSYILA